MSGRTLSERGTAVLEFVVLTVVLVVPIAQVLTTVLAVHRTRVLAQTAAAATALAVAREGPDVAERVVNRHLPAVTRPRVQVECRPGCAAAGAIVTVRVAAQVELPVGRLTIEQDHSQVVDLYAAR